MQQIQDSLLNMLNTFLSYIPQLIGAIVILIIGLVMAADALGIPQVSAVLAQLVAYIPSIIAAILILILAALLANFLSSVVRGATDSDILASIARYAIIVYAVFAAITQLRIAVELTAPTFLIVLGGVVLAAAIAFGIGSREVARDIVERAYGRIDKGTNEEQRGSRQEAE